MEKNPYSLKNLYKCIENNRNFLFVTEIEIDDGKTVIIFQDIWKKYLTVPLDPFTNKFHTKFNFDIDGNSLGKKIFHLVNDYVLSTANDNFILDEHFIFKACNNKESTIKLLSYLGAIRFMITHFNVKVEYSMKYGFKNIFNFDNENISYLIDKKFFVSQNICNGYDLLHIITNEILKIMEWVRIFLIENEENYSNSFLQNTINIAKSLNINMYTSMFSYEESEDISDQEFEDDSGEIIKSNVNFEKLKTGDSWKFELLKNKPYFGIIDGFGVECQSTIDQIFPHKIATFINTFFTKGLKYLYFNIDQFEIEPHHVRKEKLIYKMLRSLE